MPLSPQSEPTLPPATRTLLRLEGLAVAAGSAYFYARTGAHWWLFFLLWLTPDLSILSYYAGPRWGARCYNAAYTYVGPAALAAVALAAHHDTLLPYVLIWFNHIGLDRLLGYGLKSSDAFGRTHLSPPRPKSGN